MLKVNNRNTRTRHWRLSDVFIVKFEHEIWSVSIVEFEQVIPGWVLRYLEPCQTSAINVFLRIVKRFRSLNIFVESSIIDIWKSLYSIRLCNVENILQALYIFKLSFK